MFEHILIGLTMVLVLGVGAQWLAWRLHLPSILLLLVLGFLAGPVLGWVQPDELLGDLLFPVVSISVAIILFEGGLSLRFGELPKIRGALLGLILLGSAITWAVATLAAHYLMGIDWALSLLLGAILIVTGPTVIGPLLRQIQLKGQAGAVLKWEGILIDPVGAIMAVLVFEAILSGEISRAPAFIVAGVIQTVLIGLVFSAFGATILIICLRNYWIPDHLQNAAALLVAVSTFAVSNLLHPEAGLLTVTLLGIAMANQRWVSIKHIIEFKENLRVLLIGTLFILLAARLELADITGLGWQGLLFVVVLVVLARPLSVFIATLTSKLTGRERVFVSWMAPRGIVAAAVASLFAFELLEAGHRGAEVLVSATFLVIVSTVLLYGLTSGPLANRLGLSEKNPQGVLFIGAHALARTLARSLQQQGIVVQLLDTNENNVLIAQLEGLPAHHGDALGEEIWDEIDLRGIGRLLALTSNDEVNALAAQHFWEVYGRAETYQLPVKHRPRLDSRVTDHLTGRTLFHEAFTYRKLVELVGGGERIQSFPINDEQSYIDLQNRYHGRLLPLFLVSTNKKLVIYSAEYQPIPKTGQLLIALAPETFSDPESDTPLVVRSLEEVRMVSTNGLN